MAAYAKKRIMSRNLFDATEFQIQFVNNTILDDNGDEVSNPNNNGYSRYKISVTPGMQYTLKGKLTVGNVWSRIYYFDSDENFISKSDGQAMPNDTSQRTITIPANCYYIEIQSTNVSLLGTLRIMLCTDSALPYEPYGEGVWADCAVKKRIMSRNLFDYTTMVNNDWHGYINANNVSYGSSSWRITDYIPCDGTDFVLSKVGGNSPAICAYDADKRLITGQAYQSGGSSTKTDVFLHTSATAKFIRFSFYGDTDDPSSYIDPSTLMLSEGTTVLPLEPYNTPIWVDTDIKKTRISNNLFNLNGTDTSNGYLPGQYINTNDTPITPSETGMPCNTSEYIPISPDTDYYISGMPTANFNSPSVCWYDSSKARIAGQRYQNRGYVSFTAPSNAAYMRISYPIDYASQVMANVGTSALPYEPYGNVWDDGAF